MRRSKNRLIQSLGTVLLAGSVLTACANHSPDHFTVGNIKDDYRKRHPIVIQEKEHVLDIPVTRDAYKLPLAQASAVDALAFRYTKAGSGSITILMPSGSPNEHAGKRIADQVIAILQKANVPSSRIYTANYHAGEHGNAAPVRLSYNALAATVEGCGKWPTDLAGSLNENRTYHNFGCATQNNITAILANPTDLIGPRGMSNLDAGRRDRAIETYRTGGEEIEPRPSQVFSDG